MVDELGALFFDGNVRRHSFLADRTLFLLDHDLGVELVLFDLPFLLDRGVSALVDGFVGLYRSPSITDDFYADPRYGDLMKSIGLPR